VQGFLVFRVETAPEGDVAFSFGDSARVNKGFGESVELPVVADDIGFIVHVLLGILISEIDQLLLGELAFGRWVDVFFT